MKIDSLKRNEAIGMSVQAIETGILVTGMRMLAMIRFISLLAV